MPDKEQWHLSRSVPISIIVGLGAQGVVAVWMFSQMSSDIETNKQRIQRLDVQIEEIKTTASTQAVQLGRIEAQIDALMDKTDRILMAMERQ